MPISSFPFGYPLFEKVYFPERVPSIYKLCYKGLPIPKVKNLFQEFKKVRGSAPLLVVTETLG